MIGHLALALATAASAAGGRSAVLVPPAPAAASAPRVSLAKSPDLRLAMSLAPVLMQRMDALAAAETAPSAEVVEELSRSFDVLAAAAPPSSPLRAELRGYHQRLAFWRSRLAGENAHAIEDRLSAVRSAWDGVSSAAPTAGQASAGGGPGVLMLFAHPDDETMAGAAIGRMNARGASVSALYATRGEGGVNLAWQDELREEARRRGQELDHRALALLPGDHELLSERPRPSLADVREREMAEAARRYRLVERVQLSEPDLRGVVKWDERAVVEAVKGLVARVKPEIVIAMHPENEKVHVHHRAIGRIARDLHRLGELRGAELHAVDENDWYLPGTFGPRAGRLILPRGRQAAFQSRGAGAHRSQLAGRLGLLPFEESFTLLIQGLDPLRSRLARLLE